MCPSDEDDADKKALAREERGAELFDLLTEVCISKVKGEDPKAADLAVIVKFLANNGITADTLKHKGMRKLIKAASSFPKFEDDDSDESIRLAK